MYDLTSFSLKDMTICGSSLRKLGGSARSMEDAAQKIVGHLFRNLHDEKSGEPACALVRFFKTHPYSQLDEALRASVVPSPDAEGWPGSMKCLTLLATAGQRREWNSRRSSAAHRAIALPSAEAVARAPMIARLINQLGLEVGAVVEPKHEPVLDSEQRSYNVFYIGRARGSPHIPAQEDFVIRFGIESVLGFGGVLPDGNFFAVILFSKVRIPPETTELFRPLALGTKVAILPFVTGPVFA